MRQNPHHTDAGRALTHMVLTVFRANGALLSAGERLASETGLTSARWQVLGAVELAERPLTVPQIARRMGLTRQSVHATVRALVELGLLELQANAEHQRSALIRSTPEGQTAYRSLEVRQAEWVNGLATQWDESELRAANRTLLALVERLEQPPSSCRQEEQETRHASTPG